MPFTESEQLPTKMFSEDDASVENDKQFNSYCKTNIQKINATVM